MTFLIKENCLFFNILNNVHIRFSSVAFVNDMHELEEEILNNI